MATLLAAVPRALLLCATLLAGLPGQAGATAFLEAVERLRATAGAEAEQQAAALAVQRFLALPAAAAELRQPLLPAAVEAAVRAARSDLALAWWEELSPHARMEHCGWQLRALAQAGRLAELVAAAQRAAAAGAQREVASALLASEASLLPLADRSLRTGRSAEGRWVFASLAVARPDDAVRQANFALCLRNLGEYEAAEAAYRRARALDPLDAQIENDWGLFLRATGRRHAAMAAFRHSLALDTALPGGRRGQGPGVTNLVHAAALGRDATASEALPIGCEALAVRPEATMLRRLVLDLGLDQQLANGPRKR
jgi:tetratricopeptide (TPR) repeat protein